MGDCLCVYSLLFQSVWNIYSSVSTSEEYHMMKLSFEEALLWRVTLPTPLCWLRWGRFEANGHVGSTVDVVVVEMKLVLLANNNDSTDGEQVCSQTGNKPPKQSKSVVVVMVTHLPTASSPKKLFCTLKSKSFRMQFASRQNIFGTLTWIECWDVNRMVELWSGCYCLNC